MPACVWQCGPESVPKRYLPSWRIGGCTAPGLSLNRNPACRHHRASGEATVTLNGRDIYLGPHGTAASKAEYDRAIAEWIANGRRPFDPGAHRQFNLTVSDLIVRYWRHVESYFVKDGKPTSEQTWIKLALRPLRKLYGRTPAASFGPLALKSVRGEMVSSGSCRSTINGYVTRVRRMFKWAVENELVPPDVYHGLQAVAGLRRGRSSVREAEPVQPVPDEYVEAILPFVSRQVWAMVELQRLTGMRPGEVVSMRAIDIDMSGQVWHYQPERHKTQHHGYSRVVELGPRAHSVIRPFLKTDPQAFLFSPAEAEAERAVEQRQRRKTRVQPSQRNRRKNHPKRRPAESYTTTSYRRAIQRACDKADAEAKAEAVCSSADERLIPRWRPHQLRHGFATRVRRQHGLEVARVLLGHQSMAVTLVYAELDRANVAEVWRGSATPAAPASACGEP